jgi:hypothetical protein
MRVRSALAICTFVVGSLVNPTFFFGCGAQDDEFQFDAEDMAALLSEANGSLSFVSQMHGHRYRVVVQLTPTQGDAEQQSRASLFTRPAYACGSRNLVAPAAACFDSSSMEATGTLTLLQLSDGAEQNIVVDREVRAELRVIGLKLTNAQLSIRFSDGEVSLYSEDGRSFQTGEVYFRPQP